MLTAQAMSIIAVASVRLATYAGAVRELPCFCFCLFGQARSSLLFLVQIHRGQSSAPMLNSGMVSLTTI